MKAEIVERFKKFIKERHSVYLKKEAGQPKPWTKDKILQKYRFCNVYRELDAVTKWISTNIRTPLEQEPNLWFAMAIARLINYPETLREIGYLNMIPWKPNSFLKVIKKRKENGLQVYNGAYIVSTNGVSQEKSEYLVEVVLSPAWKERGRIRPQFNGEPLKDIHTRLMGFHGFGSFIAGQIIADIKYTPQHKDAPDWWTFAASGPGSRRGLNRICGYGKSDSWKEAVWHDVLRGLLKDVQKFLRDEKMPPMHAQDLQNCLCEFDKWYRVFYKEGRPKSLYPGK